jgi:hypothetical protein
MNNLFEKLDRYIDYDDEQSIRKAFNTLEKEFKFSVLHKNQKYSFLVIDAASKLSGKLPNGGVQVFCG